MENRPISQVPQVANQNSLDKKKMNTGTQVLRLACIIIGLPILFIVIGMIILVIRSGAN